MRFSFPCLGLAFAVALWPSALAAQQYQPPPAPGYVYALPYAGVPTYAGVGVSTLSVAGDVYCVSGSASKNIWITKIGLSATASASSAVTAQVVVRNAADTGAGNVVNVETYDQNNPAPTVVATSYDVAPAINSGASTGPVRIAKVAVGSTGNTTNIGDVVFVFSPSPLVLRGESQFACINVGAVGSGASIAVFHEHIETTIGYP